MQSDETLYILEMDKHIQVQSKLLTSKVDGLILFTFQGFACMALNIQSVDLDAVQQSIQWCCSECSEKIKLLLHLFITLFVFTFVQKLKALLT